MAEFQTSDGRILHYVLRGDGPLVALTPGGREAGTVLAPLIGALEDLCRVLSWDRSNTGASDICFDGPSEQAIWADDLAALLRALALGPAILAGGSAGCRVALNTALRHPDVARALMLWSASGGDYGSQFLGFSYHVPYIMAAQRGGMAAVAETPYFAERIAANPRNRERLLALDPEAFIATLKHWNRDFFAKPGQPIAGLLGDPATIETPTLIIAGNDDIHPADVSEALAARIPNAALHPSPWSTAEWMERFTGRTPGSIFDLYPRLAPEILRFVAGLQG